MSEFPSNLVLNDSDSGLLHPVDRFPTFQNSLFWYLILYLASLLLTNGLADAVHNILHNIL